MSGRRDGAGARADLAADPRRTCVITDFDGTLAPIVPDPDRARPLPGVTETLYRLAARFGRVAVVSGRPVTFLASNLGLAPPLPEALRVVGIYGLESLGRDGSVVAHPAAEEWRAAVEEAAGRAETEAPAGVRVERKGLSVTIHWREAPAAREWAEAFTARASVDLGLAPYPAKASCELRPPLAVDKGSAVTDLATGFAAACFLGDDLGDLPAFAALDRLAAGGAVTVKVVAAGPEVPEPVLAAADVVVAGPEAALAFLADLADRAEQADQAHRGD